MHLPFRKHWPRNRLSPARVALLYAAFAALWIVASGALLTFTVSDALLQSRIELAKGLVFVAVTGGLLYLLLKGWQEHLSGTAPVQASDIAPIKTTRLVLLFTGLALVVPLIGLVIVKQYGPQIEREAYANLQAIARLKAEQIENWLDERGGDGMVLVASTGFASQVGQFVRQPHDARLAQPILARFESLRTIYSYDSVLLFDAGGRLLLLLGDETDNTPELQQLLRQALTSNQIQRGNLYRDPTGHIHLEWVVPISGAQGEGPLATVVLRTTAQRFLFSLIQTWPTASPSAETLLVRREGESVVFLNELRHRQGTALTLKRALADPELPAAIALRAAKPGLLPGKDYRGMPVLAAYRPVAGTDWSIVAKIDRAEVMAPLHELALWVSLVAFSAIIALSVALLLLWRQQQRTHRLALLAQSAAVIEQSERRFRAVALSANDAIVTADRTGNIVGWNPSAERLFGYTESEINGQSLTRLMPERFRDLHRAGLARVTTGGVPHMIGTTVELAGLRKDGNEFPLELSLAQWQTLEGWFCTATIRDITERKAAEAKILRLSQFYAALSESNQDIVRCTSEEELFPKICRNAVQFGGMQMAWVGLVDPDTSMVRLAASFGDGTEYLQGIKISVDAASPFGRGLTGSAIRENRPFWCQDFQNDPLTAPWHERGALAGFNAMASLPLTRGGATIGMFNLYAGETNAFDQAARDLLVEMATDISFALDNFAREAARHRAEETLKASELRYSALFENMLDGFAYCRMLYDDHGHPVDFIYLDVNKAFERLTGLKNVVGKPVSEVIPGIRELSPELFDIYGRVASTGIAETFDFDFKSQNKWFTISVYSPQKEEFVAVFDDITERRQAEQELRIAATAFEAQEGIFVTDAHNVILRVNQAFTRLTGYSAEEAIGQTPSLLKSGRHDPDFFRGMWESLNRDNSWQGEIWNRYKNGEIHPGWLAITAATNTEGQVTNYIGTYYDITQSKEADDKIRLLAFYDPLTGLPNRRLLIDRLQQSLAASARHHNHGALLFIDLDDFKTLNDTKGHDIGDLLLVEVTNRLQACVREGDTVARLGGDEFVIMLEELSEEPAQAAAQAEAVSEKILAAISQPYSLQGYEHHGSTSIGISLFRNQEITVDELLKRADTAMYQAKGAGRNTLRFYDPAMQATLEDRTALEQDLRRALEHDEFRLLYQPQVDISSGRINGVETLLRWQHPERGLVSPLQFIPLAEETGLIVPIGEWVLKTACAQGKKWAEMGFDALNIAVNLSARQFRHKDFIATLARALADSRLPVQMLELEITESLIMYDMAAVITLMGKIKEMGIRFSIDDFGTGYSSLSYLSRFPISTLKIDQSFVRDVTSNPDNAAIVKAIITMAHSLRLSVIAEGVETESQLAFLEQHRCNEIQGYLFSKPVPAEDCSSLLTEDRRLALASVRNESQQRTLLLVDDEENVRDLLIRLLQRSGYRILSAESAEKGLELLALNDVGVILSDQGMPEMTGVEFLRLVKELYPQSVRMVLSGHTELKTITDSINEGAVYKYLTKPWDDAMLLNSIEDAFNRYEITRENAHLQISREILENLPTAIIGVDELGMITIANHTADDLFDRAIQGPLVSSQATERLPAAIMAGLKDGTPSGDQFPIILPDGRSGEVWFHRMGESCRSKGVVIVITVKKNLSHAA